MSTQKDMNLDFMLMNTSGAGSKDGKNDRDNATAVSKYLAKVSQLTAPQTEQDLMDITLKASENEGNAMLGLLKKRLEEKTKYEKVLQQGLDSNKIGERILKNQLELERRNREQIMKEIGEMQAVIETTRVQYATRGRKEVTLAKEQNRLDLQVKDLQTTLQQTIDKERKSEISLTESNRKTRELEKELIVVRIKNTRLHEAADQKQQVLLQLEDEMQTEKDRYTRGANSAKVRVIALRKAFEETQADIKRLKVEIIEAQGSLGRVRDTMRVEQQVAAAAQKDLQSKMDEEIVANRTLVAQLSERTKKVVGMQTDVRTAVNARKMLSDQLDAKMTLSLELGTRLQQIQANSQVLEGRLGDKNVEAEALRSELEMIGADVKVLQLQLTKEQHNMDEATRSLGKQKEAVLAFTREITQRVDADHTLELRVKAVEQNADLIKKDIDKKRKLELAAKNSLLVTTEKVDVMEQEIEDVQQTLLDMKDRYKTKCLEHERMELHLKEKTKQLMLDEHKARIRLSDLENTLRTCTDQVTNLKNGLLLNEVKIQDLTEMLQNASEAAEENKQNLTRRVREITEANKLLQDEINQEAARGALLETDLINAETRLRSQLAQLSAQERTAEGLRAINAKDQELLMKRLQEQTAKMERLNTATSQVMSDILSLETKLENEKVEKERAIRNLNEEQTITNRLKLAIENKVDVEMEQRARISTLEEHNKTLNAEIEERTAVEAAVKMEVDEFENKVDYLTQELREQELKTDQLTEIQNKNRAKIEKLNVDLIKQEQYHRADARGMKNSIISLQDALTDKVTVVETLVKAIQHTKSKAASMEQRLESIKAADEEAQKGYEVMLQEQQRLAASLRNELDQKKRTQFLLEAEMVKRGAKIKGLESTLVDATNRGEILKSDANTKKIEADLMADQYDKKQHIESALQTQINEKEDKISEMRRSMREQATEEQDLRKTLKQAQYMNKLLKSQMQAKMKAERYLLAELEEWQFHVEHTAETLAKNTSAQLAELL